MIVHFSVLVGGKTFNCLVLVSPHRYYSKYAGDHLACVISFFRDWCSPFLFLFLMYGTSIVAYVLPVHRNTYGLKIHVERLI